MSLVFICRCFTFFSAIWCAFNSFCFSPFLMRVRIFSVYNSPDKTFLQQFHPRLSLSATENRRHSLTIKVKMETKPDFFLFDVFSYECLTPFFSTLIAQERWSICVMELLLVNFHTFMHDKYVQCTLFVYANKLVTQNCKSFIECIISLSRSVSLSPAAHTVILTITFTVNELGLRLHLKCKPLLRNRNSSYEIYSQDSLMRELYFMYRRNK